MARAIMLQGTGSDVGKSVLVAGLCRLMLRRGHTVLPFKPQNMSNNAAVADAFGEKADEQGGEIGRAQWLQALACRVPASVHMNPVLLKPQSETGSQVVVRGRVAGAAKGRDYQRLKAGLLDIVLDSHARLRREADLVVVEGAGSPAEINLRAGDIANMGFAVSAAVPVVLVGDIDRGGVIAALAGTHRVLAEKDRSMVAGYLINKFRGDVALFDDGIAAIDRFTGWRCFGVVPWLPEAARLPAEDSVVLDHVVRGTARPLKIAVPVLPRIANFDDLDPFKAEPAVDLVFVRQGDPLPADAALVVLPGSKSTIADLADLRRCGWDVDIAAHRRRGGHVVGICGGYQMLGTRVRDPEGIEGSVREADGLGLLAVETTLAPEKTVRNSCAKSPLFDTPLDGYEIHLGQTVGNDTARPSAVIDGRGDGAVSPDGRVIGTYLHGLFSSDPFRRAFLRRLGVEPGLQNHRDNVDAALDAIAERLEAALDIEAILALAR